jgi:GT2 family glycosyltransferase
MLRDLLQSIRQTRGQLQLQTIVIDNASSDESMQMVRGEFPEVEVVSNEENEGFARANNRGTALARGEVILFLNNDIVLAEGAMQKMTEFLRANERYSAVGPRLIGRDGKAQATARNLPTLGALLHRLLIVRGTRVFKGAYQQFRRGEFDPEKSADVPQLAAAALMVRKLDLLQAGAWDESFEFGVEDVDLCDRLANLGPIRYLADVAIRHLGRISSRANSPFVFRSYELGYAYYVMKKWPRMRMWYKVLLTVDVPVRAVGYALQMIVNRLTGRGEASERCRGDLRSAWEFIKTGLPRVWRM